VYSAQLQTTRTISEQRSFDVLARLSGAKDKQTVRGTCKKCGGEGHLTFGTQLNNFIDWVHV
jgi:hypothetical protein